MPSTYLLTPLCVSTSIVITPKNQSATKIVVNVLEAEQEAQFSLKLNISTHFSFSVLNRQKWIFYVEILHFLSEML